MSTASFLVEGYVLHRRHLTDSKNLIYLFSVQFGRFTAVFRESKRRPSPSPFTKYAFDVSGRQGLKNLRSAEPISSLQLSQGRPLFCGIYLNELVMRLIPEHQAHDDIARVYEKTVEGLGVSESAHVQEVLLRRFEFTLLRELGLGVNFNRDYDQVPILSDSNEYYRYETGLGFCRQQLIGDASGLDGQNLYTGDVIRAVAEQQWNGASLKAAKRLTRTALNSLLGDKPIKARDLFS